MPCPDALYSCLAACPRDVREYNLAGQQLWARVIEMHDADSLKVVIQVGGQLYKTMTRLQGIDAPEIRTKIDKEKALAVAARDRAAAWLLPERFHVGGAYTEKQLKETLWSVPVVVLLKCQEPDKYGRLLCTVHKSADGGSLNDLLVSEGFADAYDGGHKMRSWDVVT